MTDKSPICPSWQVLDVALCVASARRTQLGRRLLHETSASLELERLLIAKLRLKCGAHFTAKVEGMVNDLQVAAGLMRAFQQQQQEEQLKKQSDQRDQRLDDSVTCLKDASVPSASLETVMIGDVEFSVQALSTAHWPTYPGKRGQELTIRSFSAQICSGMRTVIPQAH